MSFVLELKLLLTFVSIIKALKMKLSYDYGEYYENFNCGDKNNIYTCCTIGCCGHWMAITDLYFYMGV